MARKSGGKDGKAEFKGFVNISLTKARKTAVKDLAEKNEDVIGWLDTLTARGYKISFSYSETGSFYTVTAYQTDTQSNHAGYCTSARHAEIPTALAALYYGITVVLEEEGWQLNNGDYAW